MTESNEPGLSGPVGDFERHTERWHEWSTDVSVYSHKGERVGAPERLFVRSQDGLIDLIASKVTSANPGARELEHGRSFSLYLGRLLAEWLYSTLGKALAVDNPPAFPVNIAANNPSSFGTVWVGETRPSPGLLAEAIAHSPRTCADDELHAENEALRARVGEFFLRTEQLLNGTTGQWKRFSCSLDPLRHKVTPMADLKTNYDQFGGDIEPVTAIQPEQTTPNDTGVIQSTCLGCGRSFASPDFDPRCSSCVESGTGPEPSPIIRAAETAQAEASRPEATQSGGASIACSDHDPADAGEASAAWHKAHPGADSSAEGVSRHYDGFVAGFAAGRASVIELEKRLGVPNA